MERWIQDVAEYLVKNWQSLPEYKEIQDENPTLDLLIVKLNQLRELYKENTMKIWTNINSCGF